VVRTPNHHELCPCSVVTLTTTTTTTTTTTPSMPLHCWLGDRKGIRLLTVSSTLLQSPLSKGSFFFGTLSRDTARHGVISGNIGRLNKKKKSIGSFGFYRRLKSGETGCRRGTHFAGKFTFVSVSVALLFTNKRSLSFTGTYSGPNPCDACIKATCCLKPS